MTSTRFLVIQHEATCPIGKFEDWLRRVELDIVHAYRGDRVPPSTTGYAGLIVLGGDMGAYDDDAYPWLTDTKTLIARAVAENTWFLGICLGHQLATVALGGRVGPSPAGQSVGLTAVTTNASGRDDPLAGVIPADAMAAVFNRDVALELPHGASVLATGPGGSPQIVRFARRAWGVQFHPEVSPEIFDAWADRSARTDPDQAPSRRIVAAQVRGATDELRAWWRPFARRFATLAGHPSADATSHGSATLAPDSSAELAGDPSSRPRGRGSADIASGRFAGR